MQQVLLLNSSYEPLNICSWQRAMVLMVKGKAVALEESETQKVHPDRGINLPLVVRLLYYVKIPYKEISFTRKNVLHRDGYRCQYCGIKPALTIDHVLPRSRGGKDEWLNVVAACQKCNIKKGNKTPEEAHMPLARIPTKPHYFIDFELSKHSRYSRRPLRHTNQWQKYLFY